jgi:hypothetical protein
VKVDGSERSTSAPPRDVAGCGQRLTDGGSSGGASFTHSNGPRGTV